MLAALGLRHPQRCERSHRSSSMSRGRMLVPVGTKVKRSHNFALEDGAGVVSRNVRKPTTSLHYAARQTTNPPHRLRYFYYALLCTERTPNVPLCVLCARTHLYIYTYIYTYIYGMSQEECARLRESVFLMLKYTDITQNTYIQS